MKHFNLKDEKARLAKEIYDSARYIEELEKERGEMVLKLTHTKMMYTERMKLHTETAAKTKEIKRLKKEHAELVKLHAQL